MENCVVCFVQFSPNDISLVKFTDEDTRNRDKISCVYRKILRIFCKYFNLPCKKMENEKDCENQEESEILPSFPFCAECRNLVAELCIFHEKSESIHKTIQNTVAKITMKVVQTENDNENCSNSDPLETQENGARKGNKISYGYRRKILQSFNPRVHLTDCQTQTESQNQNKEKVPNEINLIAATCENDSPLNYEHYHDNSNDNDKDNDNENDVVENDSHVKTSVSSSDHSQEIENNTKQNSSLNLTLISLDENSERDETRESLIQKIRTKFNKLPQDSPPLENSIQKKFQPSDSKQQRSKKNSLALEDEMCSDVIKSLGDGKYLYTNSWPFHIIENQEVFSCDTCQSQFVFYENSTEKIYKYIIRHILVEHMNWFSDSVRHDSDGKFRFLDNWTFEKVELGFKCGHCPKIYTKINSMKTHIRAWHIPGEFQCSKCPRSFQSQGLLNRHSCGWNLQAKNRSLEISPGSGKFIYNGKKQNWGFELINGKFQCSSCPALRKNLTQIGTHIQSDHDALTSHMCDECGKIFSQKSGLKKHKLTHLKNGNPNDARKQPKSKTPCVCPHCQKTYKSSSGLGIHIFKSHKDIVTTTTTTQQETEEENGQGNSASVNYPCEKCTRIFRSPVFLKKHEDRHAELLDCPKCDKKFKSSTEAQAHLDRHNKISKFFCDVCNKGFLQKWQVKRHKETGAHSQKEETVKSKEESAQFKAKPQKGKKKRKKQEESESSEGEEEESASEAESAESESESSEAATTEED